MPKDEAEGVKWFMKAAEQNHAKGTASLGKCYLSGTGVEKDEKKGFEYVIKAAELGDEDSQRFLAHIKADMSNSEEEISIEELQQQAEEGDAQAQIQLGIRYFQGNGVEQSYTEGLKWQTKAAMQGDALAQGIVAQFYHDGVGEIEQDYNEAVKWYRKAAEQGFANAQNGLGLCYHLGHGVEQDDEKAFYWYEKAAEQGNSAAQSNLGFCYRNGEGVEQDFAKAVEWFTKAAQNDDAYAYYGLGLCLYKGNGVEQDKKLAKNFLELSLHFGFGGAAIALETLFGNKDSDKAEDDVDDEEGKDNDEEDADAPDEQAVTNIKVCPWCGHRYRGPICNICGK